MHILGTGGTTQVTSQGANMPEAMIQEAVSGRFDASTRTAADGLDPVLSRLEHRYDTLKAELDSVNRQIRRALTAAEVCPNCSGQGYRLVRGGLYGEVQRVPCSCQPGQGGE